MAAFVVRSGRPRLMQPPAPRLCQGTAPGFVSRSRGAGRRPLQAELSLAPLIGILTMMVFYLLPTFSSSGELCCTNNWARTLPRARNTQDLEAAPIVRITRQAVSLNGEPMGVPAVEGPSHPQSWKLLHDDLTILRTNFALLHPGEIAERVIIVADRDLPFRALHDVMTVCTRAGLARIHLVVQATRY